MDPHKNGDDGGVNDPASQGVWEIIGMSGLWRATTSLLVLLISAGLVLALSAPALTNAGVFEGQAKLALGLILAIVPPLLWMLLFYSQDRLEPEPHHYVMSVFILGTVLGGGVEQPLLRDLFQVQRWMEPGTLTHIAGGTLLTGILTAALTYWAVRFTVMPTNEFDEQIDGIIYGTAAALGLGVAANLTYLLEKGTISLGVGTLQIVVTSLAYATFGSIVGYFLGLIKPGGHTSWLAPLGIIIAGVLHGLYEWLATQLGLGGSTYNPWPSLMTTTIFAVIVFSVVFFLMQRSHQASSASS